MRQPFHTFLREMSDREPVAQSGAARRLQLAKPAMEALNTRATDAMLAAAFADGAAAGRAEARFTFDSELQDVRADFQHRLNDTQSTFSRAVCEDLTTGLNAKLADLHARLVEQVATAILPVLRHALTEATVRQLTQDLQGLVGDAATTTVELSGPAELVDRIWAHYSDPSHHATDARLPEVAIRYGTTPEVRIIVDDVVVESRLMEWIARTMGALS